MPHHAHDHLERDRTGQAKLSRHETNHKQGNTTGKGRTQVPNFAGADWTYAEQGCTIPARLSIPARLWRRPSQSGNRISARTSPQDSSSTVSTRMKVTPCAAPAHPDVKAAKQRAGTTHIRVTRQEEPALSDDKRSRKMLITRAGTTHIRITHQEEPALSVDKRSRKVLITRAGITHIMVTHQEEPALSDDKRSRKVLITHTAARERRTRPTSGGEETDSAPPP